MSVWHGQRPRQRTGHRPPSSQQRPQAQARAHSGLRRLDVNPHGPLVMAVGLLGIVVTLALSAPAVATTVGLVLSATVIAVGWDATNVAGPAGRRWRDDGGGHEPPPGHDI